MGRGIRKGGGLSTVGSKTRVVKWERVGQTKKAVEKWFACREVPREESGVGLRAWKRKWVIEPCDEISTRQSGRVKNQGKNIGRFKSSRYENVLELEGESPVFQFEEGQEGGGRPYDCPAQNRN